MVNGKIKDVLVPKCSTIKAYKGHRGKESYKISYIFQPNPSLEKELPVPLYLIDKGLNAFQCWSRHVRN